MHLFWKYITGSSLKIPSVGIFVRHSYAFSIETKINFINMNKGKIAPMIFPRGRVSLGISLRTGSFQLKTVANKKSKNTLRVENNQFYDGLRDTMRSFFCHRQIVRG